jgi:hypothetical protein
MGRVDRKGEAKSAFKATETRPLEKSKSKWEYSIRVDHNEITVDMRNCSDFVVIGVIKELL